MARKCAKLPSSLLASEWRLAPVFFHLDLPEMLIKVDPSEIAIEFERHEAGLNIFAYWQGKMRVGVVFCLWDDDERTRLLIGDLKVEGERAVERKRLFRRERRANFRGLYIGRQLLREVIRQAPLMGARELFGHVVAGDVENCPFNLLQWYEREGFELHEPDNAFPPDQVKKIVMRLG